MRILLLSHTNAPWTPVWAPLLVQRGHEVRVLSFHPDPIEGVDVRFVGAGDFHKYRGKHRYLTRLLVVRREMRAFAPDVVHAPYLTSNGWMASLAWRGPLVVSAVGGDVLPHPDHARWRAPLQPRIVRWVCRRAAAVHAVSRNLERALVALGVAPERIERFPVGIDLARFAPAPPPEGEAARTILCTRNHAPVYGIPTLLRALAKLPGAWRCVLAGSGHQLDAHRALAAELGLGARVRFTGPLPLERVAELLRSAAVYVSPAVSDGASSALLEALATGCLPVVSAIEANRDWVKDGVNGLLFAPGDENALAAALERGLADGELRARARAENPRRAAEEADLLVNVARLEALLGAAVHRARPSGQFGT